MIANIGKIHHKQSKSVSPYANIDWGKAVMLFRKQKESTDNDSKLPKAKDILRLLAGAGTIGAFSFFRVRLLP